MSKIDSYLKEKRISLEQVLNEIINAVKYNSPLNWHDLQKLLKDFADKK